MRMESRDGWHELYVSSRFTLLQLDFDIMKQMNVACQISVPIECCRMIALDLV